jgi:hypothetical protein
VAKLSSSLGVTRQTLYKAIEAVEEAARAALEPGKPGRKPKPEPEVRATELVSQKAALEKELDRWKTKYDVVKTLLDLERALDRGEDLPGEKKRRKPEPAPTPPGRPGTGGSATGMDGARDGGGPGDEPGDHAVVAGAAEGARGGPQ